MRLNLYDYTPGEAVPQPTAVALLRSPDLSYLSSLQCGGVRDYAWTSEHRNELRSRNGIRRKTEGARLATARTRAEESGTANAVCRGPAPHASWHSTASASTDHRPHAAL